MNFSLNKMAWKTQICVWNPSCGGRKAEWVFSEVEVDEVLGDKCTVHVFWFCLDEHKRRTDSNVSSQWLAFVRWKYFWPCSNKLSSEQEFRVAALLVRSIVREFCCPSFYTLGYIQRWRCRKQAVRLSIKYSLWISSTHLDHVPAQAFDMMACDGCIVPYVLAPHIGIIRPTKAFVKPEVWKWMSGNIGGYSVNWLGCPSQASFWPWILMRSPHFVVTTYPSSSFVPFLEAVDICLFLSDHTLRLTPSKPPPNQPLVWLRPYSSNRTIPSDVLMPQLDHTDPSVVFESARSYPVSF